MCRNCETIKTDVKTVIDLMTRKREYLKQKARHLPVIIFGEVITELEKITRRPD